MNKLNNGRGLSVPNPLHAGDTTNSLVGEYAERRRREIDICHCTRCAAIRYGDLNALALVRRSYRPATDGIGIRVGTIVTREGVE